MKLHKILFGICWTVILGVCLYVHPISYIVPYLLERFGG